jgi:hypothetical protein
MSAISAATLTRRFLPSQAFVASYFRADAVKIQQNGMNGRTLNAQSQQIGMKNRFGGILCPPPPDDFSNVQDFVQNPFLIERF